MSVELVSCIVDNQFLCFPPIESSELEVTSSELKSPTWCESVAFSLYELGDRIQCEFFFFPSVA